MIRFSIEGLDELRHQLESLQRRAENLNGPVPFSELFPPEFMRRYTDFISIEEMLVASGFDVESKEDFERIPDDQWDLFVAKRTRFRNWQEMQSKAVNEYASRRLGFDTAD